MLTLGEYMKIYNGELTNDKHAHQHIQQHKHNKLYDSLAKCKCGPGGINCGCCSPRIGRKHFKKLSHRMLRRKHKQEDNK